MLELNSNYTSKLIKFFHLHTDIRRKKSEYKQEQKTIKLLKNYRIKYVLKNKNRNLLKIY